MNCIVVFVFDVKMIAYLEVLWHVCEDDAGLARQILPGASLPVRPTLCSTELFCKYLSVNLHITTTEENDVWHKKGGTRSPDTYREQNFPLVALFICYIPYDTQHSDLLSKLKAGFFEPDILVQLSL